MTDLSEVPRAARIERLRAIRTSVMDRLAVRNSKPARGVDQADLDFLYDRLARVLEVLTTGDTKE